MNNALPITDVALACRKVLDRDLVCLYYQELTRRALALLGVSESAVEWRRQIEDVREKIAEAGQHDMFYTGKPACLVGKRSWFSRERALLVVEDEAVIIPGHAEDGADGAFEALMRSPFMQTKAPHMQEPMQVWRENPQEVIRNLSFRERIERLMRSRGRNLVLERHVVSWFSRRWPSFFLPGANHHSWWAWADHDFQLRVANRIWHVDVYGPNSRGEFSNPGHGKRRTDLHLECEFIGQHVRWRQVYTGKNYTNALLPWQAVSPKRMVVWLNCLQNGMDYGALVEYVNAVKRIAA